MGVVDKMVDTPPQRKVSRDIPNPMDEKTQILSAAVNYGAAFES